MWLKTNTLSYDHGFDATCRMTAMAARGALDKAFAIYTRSDRIVVHLYRQLVGDRQLGNTTTLYSSLELSTLHEIRISIQDQSL